jgi:hypothetical protein
LLPTRAFAWEERVVLRGTCSYPSRESDWFRPDRDRCYQGTQVIRRSVNLISTNTPAERTTVQPGSCKPAPCQTQQQYCRMVWRHLPPRPAPPSKSRYCKPDEPDTALACDAIADKSLALLNAAVHFRRCEELLVLRFSSSV